jgi:hypothetical protein
MSNTALLFKGIVSRDCLSTETICSLGLNNPPRICLTPRKSRVKNLLRNKQGNCRCKMAGTRIHSFAKLRSQMPRIATTGISPWQTALKWTADCQAPRLGCQEYMQSGQACGNPLSKLYFCLWQFAVWLFFSWQSAVKTPRFAAIRGTHLSESIARYWIPAPAILHRESPCPPVWSVLSFCSATFRV